MCTSPVDCFDRARGIDARRALVRRRGDAAPALQVALGARAGRRGGGIEPI